MIESEEKQAKEGWHDRVKYLHDVKEQAILLEVVNDDNDIDECIEELQTSKNHGWEEKVEALEKLKRIKHAAERHKAPNRNYYATISESVSAGAITGVTVGAAVGKRLGMSFGIAGGLTFGVASAAADAAKTTTQALLKLLLKHC